MNFTLYKREWKNNWILLLLFAAVLTMYACMIVSMFDPKMEDSLSIMSESMPEIFAAFGMADVGKTLLEFVTGYLYGMLLIAFPAVYIIILSNRLVARYVDNGSMAYILAVPSKRGRIIFTQAVFSISSLLVLLAYVAGVIIACSQFMFYGEMELAAFLKLNAGLFGLWIMLGGVCFLFSCIFNDTKWSAGLSTAFVVYSLLVQMVSQVGDKFENLKYITPLTMFQSDAFAAGNSEAWLGCIVMYIIGAVCYTAGIIVFTKRDLPI
ncbi:MAG: ABC transporter permease subunit [Eubacteriales bacterium]|nr:ABC transporter permease subunit [Eubacteriales bacterium]